MSQKSAAAMRAKREEQDARRVLFHISQVLPQAGVRMGPAHRCGCCLWAPAGQGQRCLHCMPPLGFPEDLLALVKPLATHLAEHRLALAQEYLAACQRQHQVFLAELARLQK